MIVNDAARRIIMANESLRLKAYRCPVGKLTIGWGHTEGVEETHVITKHQAEVLFEYDLDEAGRIVDNAVLVPLNANQYSALVSFVFNVGPGARFKKDGFVTLSEGGPSTMLRKLNEKRYLTAAEEFPKWNKGTVDGQRVVLPGLVKRRAAERALFLTVPS